MKMSWVLNKKLPVGNEISIRHHNGDDRRRVENKGSANDIIYLGTKKAFIENVTNFIPLKRVEELYSKFDTLREMRKANGVSTAMQSGEGILVHHIVDLQHLKFHIPFIDSYLNEFKSLYKNPLFNQTEISRKTDEYLKHDNHLEFYSDLVFISDKEPKPNFKWFRDNVLDTNSKTFNFIKEFLIPKSTFWNFRIISFNNDILTVSWQIDYSEAVYSCLKKINKEQKSFLIDKALIRTFNLNDNEIETIRNAIIKARLGQSKFRKDLLKSNKKNCPFTNIFLEELLLAGHIKPWSESSHSERININNGILLTPTFDKLFDKFLISFDKAGKVVFSSKIEKKNWQNLFPKFDEIQNIHIDINKENKYYLDYHRKKFNKVNSQNENRN